MAHTMDRIALGVAYVVNPLVLPPLLLVSILAMHEAPPAELGTVGVLSLLFLTVLPVSVIGWMVATGRVETLEVLRREARFGPYAAGLAGTAAAWLSIALFVETARPLMLAVAAILCVNTAALAMVNLRWKISLHAAGAAGFAAILLFSTYAAGASLAAAAMLLPVVPAVMWSRLRTRAHTSGEVWSGAAFGAACPIAELTLLTAMGYL